MNYQFRPITNWPHEVTEDRRSRYTFKATWQTTLKQLDHELFYLDASNVVFQVAASSSDIRLDGMLRANAKINAPGVILSFDSKNGPLSFPCDSCELWQHNFRSIALGLKSLRDVDRYGVTRKAEQYKGWARLPSPSGEGAIWNVPQNLNDARKLVMTVSSLTNGTNVELLELAKKHQIKFHPDRQGGDQRMSRAFNAAVELLKGAM